MKKKAKCPYCGMEGPMTVKGRCDVGRQNNTEVDAYKFGCSRCGKSFWQRDGVSPDD